MGKSSWALDEIGGLSVHRSIGGKNSVDVVSGGCGNFHAHST